MACGRPVIARRGGGVLDTVVDGVTGVFFDPPSPAALAAAVVAADGIPWQPAAIRAHAARFDDATFEARLAAAVGEAMAAGKRVAPAGRAGTVREAV